MFLLSTSLCYGRLCFVSLRVESTKFKLSSVGTNYRHKTSMFALVCARVCMCVCICIYVRQRERERERERENDRNKQISSVKLLLNSNYLILTWNLLSALIGFTAYIQSQFGAISFEHEIWH